MKRFALIVCFILLLLITVVPVSVVGVEVINSISPSGAATDETVTVTITGGNFSLTTGSVRLEKSNDEIDGYSFTWWNNTQIVCKFNIPDDADTGKWDVVVVRGNDSTEIVKADAFTITDPITLTSISPTSAQAGDDDVDFTLVGKNFDEDIIEDVFLYNEDYDDNISAENNFDVDSTTTITGTFDLEDAEEDTYEVCVENSYGTVVCDLTFRVTTNEVGSIDISSSPSGASIYIDGIANGTTPNIVDDLIVGSYKVVLRKSGYEEWGKVVNVKADDTAEIDAKLYAVSTTSTTAQTTVRTTAPTTIKTTIKKSTLQVPTSWSSVTPTEASPVDPALIIGAVGLGLGLAVLRKP